MQAIDNGIYYTREHTPDFGPDGDGVFPVVLYRVRVYDIESEGIWVQVIWDRNVGTSIAGTGDG